MATSTDNRQKKLETGDSKPVIEGFDILEELGEGGMSTVWKARQLSLNRIVVIKIISEDLLQGESNIKQFMLEAQLVASLKHANIVQVYDFGKCASNKRYYLVMEYISGYSVGDWLRRKESIDEDNALVVVESVAQALKYAWEKNRLVHCDIKPDNIMVDGDGTIKLTDMGLAQAVGKMHQIRGSDGSVLVMGTPNYMSPEQVAGDEELDCRADIYSLGASLYHMATGHLPFAEFDGAEAMEQHVSYYLQDPRKIRSDITLGTARLIEKMMMKKREGRHADWVEAIEDIRLVQLKAVPLGPAPAPGESTVSLNRSKLDDSLPTRHEPSKDFPALQPQQPAAGAGKNILHMRHVSETPPAAAPQLYPVRASPQPAPAPVAARAQAARPGVKPESAEDRWQQLQRQVERAKARSRVAGHFRMVFSLVLMAAIGYILYMRYAKKEDVLIPVRESLREVTDVVMERAKGVVATVKDRADDAIEWVQDKWQSVVKSPEKTAPAQPSAAISEEDLRLDEQPVQAPTPVATTEPAAIPAPAGIESTPEFLEIFTLCEQRKPVLNNPVVLKLKYREEPVSGTVAEISETGVTLNVAEGLVVYPFSVIKDESRLPFFPEEWARLVYARKYGRSTASGRQ